MAQVMEQETKSVPAKELAARIVKLQDAMCEKGVGGALIVQKTDLYYFSGTSQQGWLFVPAEGFPLLMVFKDFDRACSESGIRDIVSITGASKIPGSIEKMGHDIPAKLGLELDVLPTNLYFQFQAIFSTSTIEDISFDIRLIRAVKSEYEISKIRTAARLSDIVAGYVPECLAVGKTEVALAGELEGYARSLGHQGMVRMRMFNNELFYGHLMSGDGAAVPSYLASPTGGQGVSTVIGQGPGFRKIKANEPILVDYVFALDGYISDHTRIFSIGKVGDDMKRAHTFTLELQDKIKDLAKPGVLTGELYDEIISIVADGGYGENFMGTGDRRIRFVGHGIGLELDEFPFIAKGQKLPLEVGMVIALEPKMIFPGIGVVGIENSHLVTDDGLETLTKYADAITEID